MGEANRRGPREVRIAQGIVRRETETQRRRDLAAAREAALTPEERKARNKARTTLALLCAAAGVGLAKPPGGTFKP